MASSSTALGVGGAVERPAPQPVRTPRVMPNEATSARGQPPNASLLPWVPARRRAVSHSPTEGPDSAGAGTAAQMKGMVGGVVGGSVGARRRRRFGRRRGGRRLGRAPGSVGGSNEVVVAATVVVVVSGSSSCRGRWSSWCRGIVVVSGTVVVVSGTVVVVSVTVVGGSVRGRRVGGRRRRRRGGRRLRRLGRRGAGRSRRRPRGRGPRLRVVLHDRRRGSGCWSPAGEASG